ncbi:MAG: hypothetical protein K0R12_909 [Gammaproteobacteria bacterium]|jgi:YfiH family protein|nr:hypothetical protein [Gammaproteobacteria bacterium]
MTTANYLYAHWPAPPTVRALTTLRYEGHSKEPYAAFNLGLHVGDEAAAVLANRELLQTALSLQNPPQWLNQIHGCDIIALTRETSPQSATPAADGAYTQLPHVVCAILTADCLPVLLCNKAGTLVCALHVGWRGLVAGIIETALSQLPVNPAELLAWLGPAIGFNAFEIGEEVKTFLAKHKTAPKAAFAINHNGRWCADLNTLTIARLKACGMNEINCFRSNECTYANPDRFYSYRRDGQTGRHATLIWLTKSNQP